MDMQMLVYLHLMQHILITSYNPGQKSWDNLPLYPLPPPFTMLIFSGGENADESIDSSNISTLSWEKGGSKKRTKRTRCISVMRVEVCVVKCSSFRPSLLSVPKSYDQDCLKLSFSEKNGITYHMCR